MLHLNSFIILIHIFQVIWQFLLLSYIKAADDDYNIVHKDGAFEFGYKNPDSYHFADGNRNNVVRGEFGGRNPKTGGLDSTIYTAGPRGFRPRGKNVFRKYDLNQIGPRAVGSPDDPYYDPYEDPSYNFAFRTRTYSRQEGANRAGDVNGRYTYLDDVGERHNVEYIAGKSTGFDVKTPFPDSNTNQFGPLYFRGRGRPIPRGRTSIQRGLDGSYKFVSAGPDQRRTEVSDATGHVRGSYTYLDDKGVQHAVHYIAGPETGYRVLKTVKGAHLPSVFPFERPDLVAPDYYESDVAEGDVFDTAASGRPFKPRGKPSRPSPDLGNGIDIGKDDYDQFDGDKGNKPTSSTGRPSGSTTSIPRPSSTSSSSYDYDGNEEDSVGFGDLFGGSGSTTFRPSSSTTSRPSGGFRPTTGRPTVTTFKPSSYKPSDEDDDGSYKPDGDDGAYRPDGASSTTSKPTGYPSKKPGFEDEYDFNEVPFGGGSTSTYGSDSGGRKRPCPKCTGTIITNIGYKPFNVPPGVSVRAHVQSIDLYPYDELSPSEAYKADDSILSRGQLRSSNDTLIGTKKSSPIEKNN
ncbi:unnamed protein product [Ceutorhynchus assimilis]|uniref:Uncharacterized protein n=1 Tax=Ceutorhynchus assimilis TaxID=467358 RepID=A0A9N9MW10_9CUCU|nr:unnamed protein product [Ceutorhynchus assimilis]